MKKLFSKISTRKSKSGGLAESSVVDSPVQPQQFETQNSVEHDTSVSPNGTDKVAATSLDTTATPSTSAADSKDASDPLANTRFKRQRYLKNEGLGQMLLVATDENQQLVVIKLLDRGPNVSNKVEGEVVKHFKCRGHPNIIQLLDLFITPKHLAFVMEYAEGGNLRERLQGSRLTEPDARCIFQQVVRALLRYAEVNMTKRDLRMEHVLVCGTIDERPQVKLCDFAYSKTEQVNSDPKSALGSLVYTAPEEITAQNQVDDNAANVWSSGVLLYVMLCGMYPFGQLAEVYDQKQVQDMLSRIMHVKYELPSHLSEGARRLLSRILVKDIKDRYTFKEVCGDPWFLQDLPADFWQVPPVPTGPAVDEQQKKLAMLCRESQRALTSTPSADIDQLADDIMDMEDCEAAFDDLDIHNV